MSEFLETATYVIQNTIPLTEDEYEVSKAIFTDCTKTKKKRPGKRTLRAVASVAGGRAADEVGDIVGDYVGGTIEALVDGVEAVPGADIIGGTYNVAKAFYTDCTKTKKKRPGKRTLRAVASVAGGRAAAVAASTAGAYVGGAIGAAFGGVGALPCAVIGGVVGGIVGSIGGKTAVKAVVNEVVSSDSEDSGSN